MFRNESKQGIKFSIMKFRCNFSFKFLCKFEKMSNFAGVKGSKPFNPNKDTQETQSFSLQPTT